MDRLTPEETLLGTSPPDDVGAETADRFEWQAMMATADVLSVYFGLLDESGGLPGGSDFSLVCEHHEDWALVKDGMTEIVSAKHREANARPISTFRQVLNDCGVLHLFQRWKALGSTPCCRLVTTGALVGDGAKTSRVCGHLRDNQETDSAEVTSVVEGIKLTIASLLSAADGESRPEPDDATIRAFLGGLTLQVAEPRREHLPDMGGDRYGKPIAERLGQPRSGFAVWRAVLSAVRPRMRNAGPSRGGDLPVVLGVEHDTPLASRTLTLDDVDMVIRISIRNGAAYEPLPRIIKANRMAVKMTRGGCSDNAVERADELRLQYLRYWHDRRSSPDMIDVRVLVENSLRRVADEATDAVRGEEGQWGALFWRELDQRLQALEGHPDAYGFRKDILLGGLSELANDCQVWFTERFDADRMLRLLVERQEAS
jgi:hypothetical protein